MVWSDNKIKPWAINGGITPFDEKLVNPASLDLRIGNQIREPHEMWRRFSDIDIQNHIDNGTIDDLPKWGEPKTFDTFWLFPKRFVLCHSLEFVQIPLDVACILVLKSSWGRKGLNHSHCLTGDTLIDIPRDLSVNPNGIPISDLSEKQFHVYAFDTNSMKFVLAPAFAEWYFNRNRWDEVEQKYDIERKKLLQPEHRKPVVVDMAAMRKKPKEHNQRLFPALLQCVRENPGITASEINAKLGRTKQQESSVYKCIERNMERFTVVPVKCIGGTRYRFYLRQDAKQLQEIENVK